MMAAPEDLKRIKAEWGKLCSVMGHPMREFMMTSTLNYESSTGSSTLYIKPADKEAEFYFGESGARDMVSDIIEKTLGKRVAVDILKAEKQEGAGFAEIPLEERLAGTAGIPINIVE